jgi:hypothetical protein
VKVADLFNDVIGDACIVVRHPDAVSVFVDGKNHSRALAFVITANQSLPHFFGGFLPFPYPMMISFAVDEQAPFCTIIDYSATVCRQ